MWKSTWVWSYEVSGWGKQEGRMERWKKTAMDGVKVVYKLLFVKLFFLVRYYLGIFVLEFSKALIRVDELAYIIKS